MSGCLLVLPHRAIIFKVKKVEPNADVLRGFHWGVTDIHTSVFSCRGDSANLDPFLQRQSRI